MMTKTDEKADQELRSKNPGEEVVEDAQPVEPSTDVDGGFGGSEDERTQYVHGSGSGYQPTKKVASGRSTSSKPEGDLPTTTLEAEAKFSEDKRAHSPSPPPASSPVRILHAEDVTDSGPTEALSKEVPSPILPPVFSPDIYSSRDAATPNNESIRDSQYLSKLPEPILPPPEMPGPFPLTQTEKEGKRSSTPADSSKCMDPKDEIDTITPRSPTGETLDPETATFTKSKKGVFTPLLESRLRNNLLASVGFLEFGNATDFAANVWNTIPVPLYAAILMGLGGGVAIIISFFAVWDGVLSWRNIKLMRAERAMLLSVDADSTAEEGRGQVLNEKGASTADTYRIEVNKRELVGEIIDRLSMDIFMGFGALVVGTGTLMAIGGANRRVYHASNLLSGYIGNSFSLVWGICNTLWCMFILKRARQHRRIGLQTLTSEVVREALVLRIRTISYHSIMLGTTTMISAAGGMITVTRWWGYILLIPCIIASIYGNFLWRKRIGYGRPPVKKRDRLWTAEDLIKELEWLETVKNILDDPRQMGLSELVVNPTSIASVIGLIVRCDLFEDFCGRLLRDPNFVAFLAGDSNDYATVITPEMVLGSSPQFSQFLLTTAQKCIRERGMIQLTSRERYLLEMLGARLCAPKGSSNAKPDSKSSGQE